MKLPFKSARTFILATTIAVAGSAQAKELSLIRANFENTGLEASASGVARAVFTPGNPKFRLDLSRLVPDATYQLSVDGLLEESFVADQRGSVHLDFRVAPAANKLPLDFDPRNAVLSVLGDAGEVLSVVFSGEGEPEDIRVDERTSLIPAETELRGRVELRYLEQKNKDRFIVQFLGMENGEYELYVDGQLQAEVDLTKGRSTTRTFEASKNGKATKPSGKKLALDFDPRNAVVDVVRDGAIVFTGTMLANLPGLIGDKVGEASLVLTATDADVDAAGNVVIQRHADGDLSLSVDVTALPAGTYDIVIGDEVRGSVTVTGVDPTSEGLIVFSTDPAAGEFLLDFDVFGETLQVRQGTTVFLEGTLAASLTALPAATTVETELPLLNLDDTTTASSQVVLTTEGDVLTAVEVDLAGVDAGSYDFRVGTEVQGTVVVAEQNGVLSGRLVFGSGVGNELLDFDPRGQTVTIELAGTVLLSRPL